VQDSLLQFFGESEITFDKFSIKTPSGEVLKGQDSVHLEPQVFTFLLLLIRHKEHIVSRDEIVSEVWAGKTASDDAVRALVKKLRIALGDNARAPKFIKTVPLKGYLFIMPVEITFKQDKWWKHKYAIYGGGSAAVILLTLLIQSQFGSFQSNEQQPKREVTVTDISSLSGDEVSLYLSSNERLLYSEQPLGESSQQLYLRDLNKESSRRLTWSDSEYTKGILAVNGKHALVERTNQDKTEIVTFDIDDRLDISAVVPLDIDPSLLNQDISALAYSTDAKSVYLFGKQRRSTTDDGITDELETSPDTNARASEKQKPINFGLIKYELESKRSTTLPIPIETNSQVIHARESDDGGLLAVITEANTVTKLHLYSLVDKEYLHSKVVPSGINSLTWSPDATSLSFASDAGLLYNYNIQRKRLYEWDGIPFPIHSVVNQCGQYCFILKEQDSYAVDIVEKPSPFSAVDYMSTVQVDLPSLDVYPIYTGKTDDILFVSRTESANVLTRYSKSLGSEEVAKLPFSDALSSVTLSPDRNFIAGEVDKRLFILNLNDQSVRFVNNLESHALNPHWSLDGNAIYFENQSINPQGQSTSSILRYDIFTNKSTELASGISMMKPINEDFWLIADIEKKVAVLPSLLVSSLLEDNDILSADLLSSVFENEKVNLGRFPNLAANYFSSADDSLYYLSQANNLTTLHKIDLKSTELKRSQIVMNNQRVGTQLSVNSSGEKILFVQASPHKSRLVKVDGLRLVPQKISRVISGTP
jgi:DNA-binding winged helix-turn-helix (wHTH) protein/Tol biopolymer transport system component